MTTFVSERCVGFEAIVLRYTVNSYDLFGVTARRKEKEVCRLFSLQVASVLMSPGCLLLKNNVRKGGQTVPQ